MTLSVPRPYNAGCLMNEKLERKWLYLIDAQSQVLSRLWTLDGLRKITKSLNLAEIRI
jgi:hypothetical protein